MKFVGHHYKKGISYFASSNEKSYSFHYVGDTWYEGYTLITGEYDLDELNKLMKCYFKNYT
jgi:hypothetical protein